MGCRRIKHSLASSNFRFHTCGIVGSGETAFIL
jgi:hypothetical protein